MGKTFRRRAFGAAFSLALAAWLGNVAGASEKPEPAPEPEPESAEARLVRLLFTQGHRFSPREREAELAWLEGEMERVFDDDCFPPLAGSFYMGSFRPTSPGLGAQEILGGRFERFAKQEPDPAKAQALMSLLEDGFYASDRNLAFLGHFMTVAQHARVAASRRVRGPTGRDVGSRRVRSAEPPGVRDVASGALLRFLESERQPHAGKGLRAFGAPGECAVAPVYFDNLIAAQILTLPLDFFESDAGALNDAALGARFHGPIVRQAAADSIAEACSAKAGDPEAVRALLPRAEEIKAALRQASEAGGAPDKPLATLAEALAGVDEEAKTLLESLRGGER